MNITKRNAGIDALRLFSIAMVVLGHSGGFTGSALLSMWRMPLFFILAGLFLFPGRRSVRKEFTRRWETLVIPYLAWSVVISLIVVVIKFEHPADMLHHLYTGWRGGTGRSIFWMSSWFLLTLAISAVLLRYLERYARWVSWAVAIVGIIASRVFEHLNKVDIIDGHPFAEVPLRLGISLPVLLYLLIGQEIRQRLMPTIEQLSMTRATVVGSFLIVAPLFFVWYFAIPAHYIHAGKFGWPFITPAIATFVTIGFIMIFSTSVNHVVQKLPYVTKFIGRLARTGSTVVLTHGLVLLTLYNVGFGDKSLSNLLLRFGITLIVSFGVGLCINMSTGARVFSGVPRERPIRFTIAA